MRKLSTTVGFLFLVVWSVLSQQEDFHWVMGYDSNNDPDYSFLGGSDITFFDNTPDTFKVFREMNIQHTLASICDPVGNLLLYTNGIFIADSDHETVINSEGLNPGLLALDFGPFGYPVPQGALFLPMPGDTRTYSLFHLRGEPEPYSSAFFHTLIQRIPGEEGFQVLEKNVPILQTKLADGKLTGVKHANGRDWWLFVLRNQDTQEDTTRQLFRFLVDDRGIHPFNSKYFDRSIELGLGQVHFSPDGTKYAMFTTVNYQGKGQYLDIFEFDRCSGSLSNRISHEYFEDVYSGGLVFAPNSELLYVLSYDDIYQYDLTAPDVIASRQLVATMDINDWWPQAGTFFQGQIGPDGKIYIANGHVSAGNLHVIHRPNVRGPGCMVEIAGLKLPTFNAFSIPNIPNFRLGPLDGSPCDTLGLNNLPWAHWRWAQEQPGSTFSFLDLSAFEPTAWSWEFGDGAGSTERFPTHTYTAPGTYTVCLTVSNAYGQDTFCRELLVDELTHTTAPARPAAEYARVYPNPAGPRLFLTVLENLARPSFHLQDALGREVSRWAVQPGAQPLDVSRLPAGLYTWQLREAGRLLQSGRVVKE